MTSRPTTGRPLRVRGQHERGKLTAMHDIVRMWWCTLDQQSVDLNDDNEPACGPDMQCSGGRRRSLPCGWYDLVPIEVCGARNPDPQADHHGRCLRVAGHGGKHDDLFRPPWGSADAT